MVGNIPTMGIPADWNRDGEDDLIVSDRFGFLYWFERKGSYPDITFEYADRVRDSRTGEDSHLFGGLSSC
jgi:hypothetical protein